MRRFSNTLRIMACMLAMIFCFDILIPIIIPETGIVAEAKKKSKKTKLDKEEINLELDKAGKVVYKVTLKNTHGQKIKWKSRKKSIVKIKKVVNKKNKSIAYLYPTGYGSTYISAETKDDIWFCDVDVAPSIPEMDFRVSSYVDRYNYNNNYYLYFDAKGNAEYAGMDVYSKKFYYTITVQLRASLIWYDSGWEDMVSSATIRIVDHNWRSRSFCVSGKNGIIRQGETFTYTYRAEIPFSEAKYGTIYYGLSLE